MCLCFQAEDGIRGLGRSRGLGDVYKRQGPDDVDVAEVYDLSAALELDWYEDLGFCEPGEAEGMIRDGATTIGGRLPVNPSGGLACFGEAVPAQAIAPAVSSTHLTPPTRHLL